MNRNRVSSCLSLVLLLAAVGCAGSGKGSGKPSAKPEPESGKDEPAEKNASKYDADAKAVAGMPASELLAQCSGAGAVSCAAQALENPQSGRRETELFEASCLGGFLPACIEAAKLYRDGEVVEKDEVRASSLMQHTCRKDFSDGCYSLGSLGEKGTAFKTRKDGGFAFPYYHSREQVCPEFGRVKRPKRGPDGRPKFRGQTEFVVQYANGKREFSAPMLARAEMLRSNITNANLRCATFAKADLRGADLTGTVLHYANFLMANLTGAHGITLESQTNANWVHATCPDGTKADDNQGTCVGHLTPSRDFGAFAPDPNDEKECLEGKGEACYRLAKSVSSGVQEADALTFAFEQKACAGGDSNGCVALARSYGFGEGTQRKPELAMEILQKGCDAGHAESCDALGDGYRFGWSSGPLQENMRETYKRACSLDQDYCQGAKIEKNKKIKPRVHVKANQVYTPNPSPSTVAQTHGAKAGLPGSVKVFFCVSRAGGTEGVRISTPFRRGEDPLVDSIAVETVKTWRFTPFLIDGEPQKTCSTMKFNFKFK